MDKTLIKEINKKCPYGQGIFVQPNGIPVSIKEPVIYSSYVNGGMSGGGYWDNAKLEPFISDKPKDHMLVLDLVLEEICPTMSFLHYKRISKFVRETSKRAGQDYYGNYDDYVIEYIILSQLEEMIAEIETT